MLEFELVLPCYNEEKSLRALVGRAVAAAKGSGFTPDRFQLVLVENGSQDGSSRLLDELKGAPSGAWFRKVSVLPNEGYGNGVWRGLQTTTAAVVAWSHADQQCDPADVFRALETLKKAGGKSLVKGMRTDRDWKDVFVSRFFEALAKLILGIGCRDINAQPKVFSRELLREMECPPKSFAFDLYVLFRARKAGYAFHTVDVRFPPRAHGASNWAGSFFSRYKTILGMIRYMFELARKEGRV